MAPDHESGGRTPPVRTAPGRVRPARPGDSLPLHRLQRHLPDPSPSLLELGLTASGSAGGTVLVSTATAADGTESVVGYVLFVDGPTARHVAELVVGPAFRREGRGRELLSAVRVGTDAPVTLLVAVENEAARSLYESCGFRAVERLPDEYGDRDAVRYRAAVDRSAEADDPQ
ncbi:GNAT family N-acetyltransferase [Halopenitus persicus]|uniref:Ribosomal-protein-alanine N-acetyltransferase n=1 Tax=Halopenitus persicus TaxID=1048396 RepID=A0A1H3EDZ4_9EURY|nr:N-acetyltransferase [Halopenitus persicus]QHS17522.1 GNAT family N-acetyltransferase [haloarchaeon 3A1-DGR]SDX76931.1 ribosomal-protein-alanine N-acetyltransferase [Halopenitus persicus]